MQFRIIELCNTLQCCFRIHKPCYTLQCMTVHSGLSSLARCFKGDQGFRTLLDTSRQFRAIELSFHFNTAQDSRTSQPASTRHRTIKAAIRFECISGHSFFATHFSAVEGSRTLLYGSTQFRRVKLCQAVQGGSGFMSPATCLNGVRNYLLWMRGPI